MTAHSHSAANVAEAILETLKDVSGIIGSALVARSGSVIAQDLPSYFGSAAYEAAPRTLRLEEALSVGGAAVSFGVLRFEAHKLAFRPAGDALLWVLGSADVNMPALRMAMSLVARKLEKLDFEPSVTTPPPPTTRPPASPEAEKVGRSLSTPEASGAQNPNNRPIYFRGKRIS